jgi:predicted permease
MFRRRVRKPEDFAEEIQAHLELEADRLRAEGLAPDDAGAAARRGFGNLALAQERHYESARWLWWDQLRRDASYAVRVLSRRPGFTSIAVLTLALGIGANALVFSVVNALVLRPLPVAQPEQMVFLESSSGAGQSFPNYRDLRDRNQALAGLVGYRIAPMELDSDAGAGRIWGYLATGNYFDVLGVAPLMGRFFHPSDDVRPGASPYAVLSYGSWRSRFGGDPGIVGKTIRINRLPYTVVGVAQPDFHGTELFYWPEVWVPMMMQAQIEAGNSWLEERSTSDTWIVGRLKPGVSPAQAETNLNAVAAQLAREYPVNNEGLHFKLAKPGLVGDLMGGPAKAFTLGVLGLAAVVLLAACANLASLVTARAADRQREIAIRLSIGAGRGRVVRQVLTESLVLSLAGGAVGYALAVLLSRALTQFRAPMDFPVQFNVNPDWREFLFAFAAAIAAGVLFGSAPAWRASKTDSNTVLKGAPASGGRQRLATRDLLVVVQVALCFVLVSACLLAVRGLQHALNMRLGFDPRHVSVVAFDLGLAGYGEEQGHDFQRRALERVAQLPGVTSAAFANSLPLSIDQSHTTVFPGDKSSLRPSDGRWATFYQVSPGYFAAMETSLFAGRDFTWSDDRKSPRVAIVNVAFARQVLNTANPVGKYFRHGPGGGLVQVIGMAEDGKYESLTERQRAVAFWPMLQSYNTTTTLIARSARPETQTVAEMRQTVGQLDPEMPLYGTGSLQQMLGFAFFPARAAALALGAFGVLAIMLAVTGIHGLIAYAVARRVREIGIRMAIGARPSQVLRLILLKMALLVVAGSVIGLGLSLAAGVARQRGLWSFAARSVRAGRRGRHHDLVRRAFIVGAYPAGPANRSDDGAALRIGHSVPRTPHGLREKPVKPENPDIPSHALGIIIWYPPRSAAYVIEKHEVSHTYSSSYYRCHRFCADCDLPHRPVRAPGRRPAGIRFRIRHRHQQHRRLRERRGLGQQYVVRGRCQHGVRRAHQ